MSRFWLFLRRVCFFLASSSLTILFLLYVLDINIIDQAAQWEASLPEVAPPEEKEASASDNTGFSVRISGASSPVNDAQIGKTLTVGETVQGEPAEPALSSYASALEDDTEEWILLFEDDFALGLDTAKWTPMRRRQNYNQELQYYVEKNAQVMGGKLFLIAEREQLEGKKYTSALVDTNSNFSFLYGRVDVRLKIPQGKGLFPAVWLLPENASNQYSEIDLLEVLGDEPSRIYGVCHYGGKKTYGEIVIENPSDFHTYSLEWNEDELKWYVDDMLYFRTTRGVPHEPMFIIMNLAVGGEWPGSPNALTPFPNALVVDYIRVYQHASAYEGDKG